MLQDSKKPWNARQMTFISRSVSDPHAQDTYKPSVMVVTPAGRPACHHQPLLKPKTCARSYKKSYSGRLTAGNDDSARKASAQPLMSARRVCNEDTRPISTRGFIRTLVAHPPAPPLPLPPLLPNPPVILTYLYRPLSNSAKEAASSLSIHAALSAA